MDSRLRTQGYSDLLSAKVLAKSYAGMMATSHSDFAFRLGIFAKTVRICAASKK